MKEPAKRKKRAGKLSEALLEGMDLLLPSFEPEKPIDLDAIEQAPLKPAWEAIGLPKKLSLREFASKRTFYDYSEVQNCIDLIERLPEEGETIHAIMNSLFKGVDVAPAVQKLANRPAKELVVTTLGFNRKDAACLVEMLERGEIKALSLVCSNFFAEKDRGAFTYTEELFKQAGARLAVNRNHSKIMLFDFGKVKYVVESSANLRSCNNVEQFCLTRSEPLFTFHRNWIEKMFR